MEGMDRCGLLWKVCGGGRVLPIALKILRLKPLVSFNTVIPTVFSRSCPALATFVRDLIDWGIGDRNDADVANNGDRWPATGTQPRFQILHSLGFTLWTTPGRMATTGCSNRDQSCRQFRSTGGNPISSGQGSWAS